MEDDQLRRKLTEALVAMVGVSVQGQNLTHCDECGYGWSAHDEYCPFELADTALAASRAAGELRK